MRIPQTLTLNQLAKATAYELYTIVNRKPPYPLVAKIELTRKCNANCTMCKLPTLNQHPDITKEQLTHLLNQLKNTILITPFGFGEPLMHPQIIELLNQIRQAGKQISLSTNASLSSPIIAYKLMEQIKPYLTVISIDAGEKEPYEHIRKGLDFDTVRKNIIQLTYLKNTGLHTEIELSACIGKHNQNQIEPLCKLTEELGAKNLIFAPLDTHGTGNATADNQADSAQVIEAINSAKKKHPNLKIRHTFQTPRKCNIPTTELYIETNGNIHPCCILTPLWNMGNAYKEKITDIWNSPPYQHFRILHKNNQIPECNKCRGIPNPIVMEYGYMEDEIRGTTP